MKTFHISVFVPHQGCPNDCVFCNQRKITGVKDVMSLDVAKETIDSHLESIKKNYKKGTYKAQIAFFGGSFTAIDKGDMISYLKLASSYVISGEVDGIRCSTRPDAIDEEIVDILKSYNVKCVELGAQSAFDDVLKASNRGHNFSHTINASKIIKSKGLELTLQMMTGLIGDSKEKSIETAKRLASLKPQSVRIYPTLVMDNTKLKSLYDEGKYKPQTLTEAIDTVSEIIDVFKKENISILRIGLQTTDNVNQDTVIGPYHSAFAELCYSNYYKKKIEKYILENNIKNDSIYIDTSKYKLSQIIGHKKENQKYFKEKYNVNLTVKKDA